jgi:SAM-dependent methyltransferase/transposase-like protein
VQLFTQLDPETEAALTASIERFGVLIPVVVDQHGDTLDGHHRRAIAIKLDVDCPVKVVHVNTDDERAEIARTLNMDRRQLTPKDRKRVVADLRRRGFSTRTIAKATGVDPKTVRNDLAGGEKSPPDAEVKGADGKKYPANKKKAKKPPKPEPGDTFTDDHGEARTVAVVEEHDEELVIFDGEGDAAIVGTGRFEPRHPAKFNDAILAVCAAHLPSDCYSYVLDPFAGTGRIHELPNETIGIEIEREWADLHYRTWESIDAPLDAFLGCTLEGDALDIPFDADSFDAICTSPTYGNRMADHHDARDDSLRNTYKHALGRDLSPNNSGAMQWGDEYRAFHRRAWAEATRVLRPGGRFVLNIKDHVRAGKVQPVTGWHITTLVRLGLDLTHIEPIFTSGIRGQENGQSRLDHEWVIVLDKASAE